MSTDLATEAREPDVLTTITKTVVDEFVKSYKDCILDGVRFNEKGVLVIDDVDRLLADDEGRERIGELAKRSQKMRTTCVNEHESMREGLNRQRERIIESQKALVAQIQIVENRCKGLLSAIENEKLAQAKAAQDIIEAARKSQIAAVGGIPEPMRRTMQADFVRVAAEPQFQEWLAMLKVMNETAAEAERLRKEQAERDRQEAQRKADEKAEADRLQREADEAARLENKRVADELAARQKELDAQAEEQRQQQQKLAAQQQQIEAEKAAAAERDKPPVPEQRAYQKARNGGAVTLSVSTHPLLLWWEATGRPATTHCLRPEHHADGMIAIEAWNQAVTVAASLVSPSEVETISPLRYEVRK